ncbi:hypothetical protein Glove_25g47 [Diversispora epigaea]|uniref:Attractin/MKLN-like beta-propeller domain-containing protein n=1 Tax=Diversispora epigaea TaxID=1348612 RepID=A0A397JKS4_9GLOM|nr:hypothetical protein Glove_25g47 [Diversispora epigaea]
MNFPIFYFCLFVFFFLQCSIINASFEPKVRNYHSSVYIENKLYILGGYNNGLLDNLLYLDLSNSFHKDHPPWYNLDFREIPFGVYKAAASFGGIDNSTIFLIGGERSEKEINYVYSFNTKSFIWNDSLINDNNSPEWHVDIQGVTDRNGKIYIYGGWLSGIRSNKLSILDTLKLSWKTGPSPDSQNGRYGNTITLLSNGIIVIIGGYVDGGGGLYEILLYDINENNWSSMITQGIKLSDRVYHTAVLVNDGRIIVYGGTKNHLDPDLVVLDTNLQPFKWSTPEVNAINSPPLLFGHTADIIGDYMILVFGVIPQSGEYNRYIYLMDVKNYTWVTDFHPEKNIITKTEVITITSVVTTTNEVTTTDKMTITNILTTTTTEVSIITGIPEPPKDPESPVKYFITKRKIFQLFGEIVVIFLVLCENLNPKHISTYFFILVVYTLFVFAFNLMLFFR